MSEEKIAFLEGHELLPMSNVMNKHSQPVTEPPKRLLTARRWPLVLASVLALTALTLWQASPIRHCHKILGHSAAGSTRDRVDKILSETPLIGTCIHLNCWT
jgi:hypothetical protein